MAIRKLFILTLLFSFLLSCGNDTKNANDLFAISIKDGQKSFKTSEVLSVSIQNKKNKAIETVAYSMDGVPVNEAKDASEKTINLEGLKMGKRILTAQIGADGETYTISKEITITASKAPTFYGYKIIETYPHDQTAFTQGLEFENDTLYEGTGKKKQSTLRKVDYKTGNVLKKEILGDQYFGEGITILNDKVYQLTWQEKTGFIYDLNTFEKKGTFVYGKSEEGWGLCNDGSKIYKSDGTEKIWTLNANTLAEEGYIELYTNDSKIPKVNELEWVEGKIYANVWQREAIAIINPSNGAVEGVINLKGLQAQVTQHSELDVLNGIAYNGEPNMLYVTGKYWDTLFKIEVVKQ